MRCTGVLLPSRDDRCRRGRASQQFTTDGGICSEAYLLGPVISAHVGPILDDDVTIWLLGWVPRPGLHYASRGGRQRHSDQLPRWHLEQHSCLGPVLRLSGNSCGRKEEGQLNTFIVGNNAQPKNLSFFRSTF